jgi:hypothetical protein
VERRLSKTRSEAATGYAKQINRVANYNPRYGAGITHSRDFLRASAQDKLRIDLAPASLESQRRRDSFCNGVRPKLATET